MPDRHDAGPDVDVSPPERAAAGTRAVYETLRHTVPRMGVVAATDSLLRINQTDGFDCPGCAWPERRDRHRFEFCETGAKVVAENGDRARCTPGFFGEHAIAELAGRDDFWLNAQGRLTHPMVRRAGGTHYEPIGWHDALDLIAHELASLPSPDAAAFYTSGRASNEAAFAYQLMVRAFGTNNLPDCSNLCHEPTSVALEEAIGIGKGSVTFEDFDATDLVMVVGQNPGTNHPRMLVTLEEVARRGGHIVDINPLPEAGLRRFRHPQHVRGLIGRGTRLSDLHVPVRLGGDQALFRWLGRQALEAGRVDWEFVRTSTEGFDAYAAAVLDDAFDPVEHTGVDAATLALLWDRVAAADRIIVCWAMGITQHRDAVATIREITNFALLTGNIGRRGAGLAPIRGHSNVQGDRTMGIWHEITPELRVGIEDTFAFTVPERPGLDALRAVEGMLDGSVRAVVSLGGNLARALPDTEAVERALAGCRLTVNVSTRLNRSHVVPGEISLILPALTRTDADEQATGLQFVTVEDSFGTVHQSRGSLTPASALARSEVSIIAGLGRRIAAHAGVPWDDYEADYRRIRADIARVVPGFERFEDRVHEPGGFLLPHPPRDRREFPTPTGKAGFATLPLHPPYGGHDQLVLQSIRSHDQFNTTIHGLDDRYRGISGGRRVVLVNREDLDRRGLADGDLVDVVAAHGGTERAVTGVRAVAYPTPPGSVAMYYPEANVLVALGDRSPESGIPAYKSVPVVLRPVRPGSPTPPSPRGLAVRRRAPAPAPR